MLFIAAIEVFIFMLIIEGLRKHSTGLSLWVNSLPVGYKYERQLKNEK